ncbi:MAG: element excision factor XisI family protein [Phormidesmis sp.]
MGWRKSGWVHSCTMHVDIKDGKIWIQWNGTEDDLAAELVALGVPSVCRRRHSLASLGSRS